MRMGIIAANRRRSAVFTPAAVPSVVDYFEVRAAKLWKDTAGTVPVTADGDLVARHDGELGIITRLQATSANRPIYRISGGVERLEFDGNRRLASAAFASAITQPYYWIIAGELGAFGAKVLTDGISAAGRGSIFADQDGGVNYWRMLASVGTVNWGLTPSLDPVVLGAFFNGAASVLSADGVDGLTTNAGTAALNGTLIGTAYTGGAGWVGDYHGDVLIDAAPSSTDKAKLLTWLAALQGRVL